MTKTTYLGDGVYAEYDGYNIWIWTSDGINVGQKIALEPPVLDTLSDFRKYLLEQARISQATAREDAEDADKE